MHNWFECKVSYEKMLENGMQKKVTEPYLVDALSFTEAEARIIEEIRPFITGEFTVADVTRKRYSELFFNENGDRYYEVKVYFITLDERSGAEKRTAAKMLCQASTLKEAIAVLEEGMKGTMADYTIASVSETQIMDVFPYEAEKEKDSDLKKTAKDFVDSIPEGTTVTISTSASQDQVIIDKTNTGNNDIRRVEEDVSTGKDTKATI